MSDSIYQFGDIKSTPTNNEVGGKGYSLIKMSKAGLHIPPGFVLAVDFFKPWIDILKHTSSWKAYIEEGCRPTSDKISEIKAHCTKLSLTEEQNDALDAALSLHPEIKQFAVRSSSPEEDLSGASFAGGYETVLGVNRDTMLDAIKTAFASCLDSRVFVYKKQQGFSINDFRIAIVIMEQIASEIAGVGFSVDPISNDYDIAIFNANWGLGETVVSGLASPDQFTVDKVKGCLIDKQLGTKEVCIWLQEDGGTDERADKRHAEFTLTEHQVLELNEQLCQIETLYDCPMDIEWAFSRDRLFLLQARPITTYVPLPRGMKTRADAPRRLYLDLTLSVQGLEKPLSSFGTDFIRQFLSEGTRCVLGHSDVMEIKEGALDAIDGKIYLNLSNVFTKVSRDAFANWLWQMDAIASDIVRQLGPTDYQRKNKPKKLRIQKWRIALNMYDVAFKIFTAKFRIKQLENRYKKDVKDINLKIHHILNSDQPLSVRINQLFKPFAYFIVHKTLPALIIGQRSIKNINALFSEEAKKDKEVKAHLDNVSRSLPHNITIDMGLDIYHLSRHLNKADYPSNIDLLHAFETKKLSTKFYESWKQFIKKYGARGTEEFDISSPRYNDSPTILINQVYGMLECDKNNSPETIYKNSQERRKESYGYLLGLAEKKGSKALKNFQNNYRLMEAFGGYRENHKFFLVSLIGQVRELLLRKSTELVGQQALSHIEQIFDLKLEDLVELEKNKTKDMSEKIADNIKQILLIDTVKRTPPIIDSRGHILHPKRSPLKANEIGGQAVSTGTVRGVVKVLHTPDEKPLLQNEILVARATDPGWTPLFVNAGAIVLEVGGMLQHGALVAREYGKPCVAGVENATEVLKDGDFIEIDGTTGIITRLTSKRDGAR
jgi:pyruvate,water dikinase